MSSSSINTFPSAENLARLRDELALQAHLFKSEAKDRWQETELQWQRLQEEVRAVKNAIDHSRPELHAATSIMADTLHRAFTDIRQALARH